MLPKSYVLFILLLALLLNSACSPRIADNIPTIRYQNLRIEQVQPQLEQQNLKLKLAMRFLFKNPLNKDLTIPAHDLNFLLNGKPLSGDINEQPSFVLEKKSEQLIAYYFTFDLNPQGVLKDLNVLGKDNYFELVSEFKLNLNDFGVDLPSRFSTYTFELAFGDTLRLPLLPSIKPSGQMAKVELLGQMEELNLQPFKTAASPFVSLLNKSFHKQDPFLKLMLETKVPFTDVYVADHVIATFFAFDPQASQKWEALKSKLAPAEAQPVMDQIVNTFLRPIDTQAPAKWSNFKLQWNNFYEHIPDKLEYPGPRISGLLVEVPFIISNPNEFSIEAPTLVSSADLASFQPIAVSARPVSGNEQIAAGEDMLMKMQVSLRWGDEDRPGLAWLLSGEVLQPTLSGSTRLDLGYGPLNLDMEIPISLQVGD
ncbi:hypothetical protein PZB74_05155 [Porifericola rhodea]|uniref:hypothetical protein n=1 Tax=Porifericola rhodea TaxID=930972 RepID=UPI0026662007|nr:hypothetical protein [Porifericola rhodea]WKN32732.1 hypothetical protein PZB74_05155 [Porifericola rhodea]